MIVPLFSYPQWLTTKSEHLRKPENMSLELWGNKNYFSLSSKLSSALYICEVLYLKTDNFI